MVSKSRAKKRSRREARRQIQEAMDQHEAGLWADCEEIMEILGDDGGYDGGASYEDDPLDDIIDGEPWGSDEELLLEEEILLDLYH